MVGNLCAAYRCLKTDRHQLWVNTAIRATTKTLEKASQRIPDSQPFYLDGKVYADLALRYHYNKVVQLSLDVENLFNTSHIVGGTSYFPYERLGRTFMASVSFNL